MYNLKQIECTIEIITSKIIEKHVSQSNNQNKI